jgi:predicted MFS family arabinose efflux permease
LIDILRAVLNRIVENYRAAFRGLSREIWFLSLISLVNRSGTMVVIFLAPYLTKQLGYEASEAGNLLALYGLGNIAGIWLGGRLTDRFGFRPVIITSLLATGTVLFALGQVQSPIAISIVIALLGLVGETLRPATSVAIVIYSTPQNRTRAFGLLRLSLNLGLTIGPTLGGLLASYDYGLLFPVDALTCISAGLLFVFVFPRHGGKFTAPTKAEKRSNSLWRDRLYLAALALTFLHALTFFQLSSTFPLYLLEQRGWSERAFGALFAVNTMIIVLFEMVLVHAIEKRSPLKVVALASLLVGLGFGLTPYATTAIALVGTVLLWTLGEMLAAPMMQTWVANRSNDSNRGQYLAAYSMVFSLTSVAAPWAGTRIYQHIGPDWVWHACLAIGVIAFLGFLKLASIRES